MGGNAVESTITAPEGITVNGNTIKLTDNPSSEGSYEVKISAILEGVVVEKYVTINYTNLVLVDSKVFYSADDKALDLVTLNAALNAKGVEDIELADIEGYIVNGEQVDALELEVIISNNTKTNQGRNRSVDTAQEATVLIGGKLYVLSNVYAYTKVIDEAEDLKYFTLKGATDDNPYNEVDGYFVLSKNIDASELVLDNHVFMSGVVYPGNGYNADVGFRGVLDGLGFTVDGLTTKSCGLFAAMNAPVVKNIAFTNVNLSGYYGALFANKFIRGKDYNNDFNGYEGKFENVYVSVNSINYVGSNGAIGIFVQGGLPTAAHLENVIVDFLNVDATTQSKIDEGNQFLMFGSSALTMASATTSYKNCYSISTAPVLQYKKMPGFAENQVEYTLTGNKVTAVGNVLDEQVNEVLERCGKTLAVDYVIVGLRAYDDYKAMADDNNDYASFSADYWTIVDGVPVWTTAM